MQFAFNGTQNSKINFVIQKNQSVRIVKVLVVVKVVNNMYLEGTVYR